MGGMDFADGWHPTGTVGVRLQCPECDWSVDEPPMETATEMTGDGMVMRVRQQSALPALAAHVVVGHPDSDLAGQIRAYAAAPRPEPVVPDVASVAGATAAILRSLRDAEESEALARVAAAMRWLPPTNDE